VVIAALNQDRRHLPGQRKPLRLERNKLEDMVKDSLAKFLREQTHRRPIIIPVIVEVVR